MKTKLLLSSAMVIAVCICLIAGSTFALFTTTTTVNIAVTSGDLEVYAVIDESTIKTASMGSNFSNSGSYVDSNTGATVVPFENGGSAQFTTSTIENTTDKIVNLSVAKMTPGDAIQFEVVVENRGDVAVQYKVKFSGATVKQDGKELPDLSEVLTITVKDKATGAIVTDEYAEVGGTDSTVTFIVEVTFPKGTAGQYDEYQKAGTSLSFIVETIQQNAVPTTP